MIMAVSMSMRVVLLMLMRLSMTMVAPSVTMTMAMTKCLGGKARASQCIPAVVADGWLGCRHGASYIYVKERHMCSDCIWQPQRQ